MKKFFRAILYFVLDIFHWKTIRKHKKLKDDSKKVH